MVMKSTLLAILKDLDDSHEYIGNRKFKSLYFGGGTPSLISVKIIEKIINRLNEKKLLEEGCEVSFELNPKEVKEDYINNLVSIGINRVSIGIQSFDANTLSSPDTISSPDIKAIEIASGVETIDTTIDLIYGVMGQSLESLQKDSLEQFVASKANHLSLYQLTIEPNTIFYKKELHLPSDVLIESMEDEAKEILNKNNLYQYEVSSWAKKGRQSKHNMNYWMYGDYLGLGSRRS